MEACGKRVATLLLLGASIIVGRATNDVIPMPKLRPEDPSKFFPSVVRLDKTEVAEAAALFRKLGREDMALQVEKSQALRAVPPDALILTSLLGVSSDRVNEWALRGLGEHPGDKQLAVPVLLRLACDSKADEMSRALAVRVLGTTLMGSETIAKLATQIETSGKELSALILEVIGGAGEGARPVIPALRKYLNAPEALVQYYAFEAIQKIDRNSPAELPHYRTAQQFLQLRASANAPDLLARSLAALADTNSPGYLRSVALQNLITAGNDPTAVSAVLNSVGDGDLFISELAANILARINVLDGALDVLAGSLSHADSRVRLHGARALRRSANSVAAVPAISDLMREAAAGRIEIAEVGVCLDVLRALGSNATPASVRVGALLPENCPIYRDVEKHEVDRFRGFILVTLAEIGVPKEATPFIADALVNSDERMSYSFAGAARAAGSLGTNAAHLLPHLLRPLERDTPQDFLEFAEFDTHFLAGGEYTTCQVESLRALRRIGPPAQTALPAVRAFLARAVDWVASPDQAKRMPLPTAEARQTIAALESRGTRTAQLHP
jgi:hypothetical protein